MATFTNFNSWTRNETENSVIESYKLSNGAIIRFVVDNGEAIAIDASALGNANRFDPNATYQKMQDFIASGAVTKL